jgi:hypothetical protein
MQRAITNNAFFAGGWILRHQYGHSDASAHCVIKTAATRRAVKKSAVCNNENSSWIIDCLLQKYYTAFILSFS